MERLVTPKQVLKNEQQYHSITTMAPSTNVRGFVCAMSQHLRAYISPGIAFSYKWARLPDGTVYFALSGGRAVQDAFKAYLINNKGSTLASAEYVSFGRNNTAFHRTFNEYFEQRQLPNGFASGGSQ
ncbi:hypothetical protein EKA85_09015 [Pseudomonas veronii]|uniref:hypothetical protein n=1 Tax=Pseudomonas TaxID=286 RepID=UPI000F847EE1|nr:MULTISPECIES: hypothetical protein [Pseudomonas]MDY7554725.1 hypothetical protein [Pseudomonas sp. FG1]MEB0051484.1 hypothetical protein [Pseudomonas sp. FG1]RTY68686.1 hypothetical protein EKA85_09015 [Pseudomonas veronii]